MACPDVRIVPVLQILPIVSGGRAPRSFSKSPAQCPCLLQKLCQEVLSCSLDGLEVILIPEALRIELADVFCARGPHHNPVIQHDNCTIFAGAVFQKLEETALFLYLGTRLI